MGPFVWVPGTARAIALFGTAALAHPDRPVAGLPLRWPDHRATAVLDYALDAADLRTGSGDALSVTAAVATGITLLAVQVIGGSVVAWLGAASAAIGADATLDLTLQTAGGRRVHRIIRLRIA